MKIFLFLSVFLAAWSAPGYACKMSPNASSIAYLKAVMADIEKQKDLKEYVIKSIEYGEPGFIKLKLYKDTDCKLLEYSHTLPGNGCKVAVESTVVDKCK